MQCGDVVHMYSVLAPMQVHHPCKCTTMQVHHLSHLLHRMRKGSIVRFSQVKEHRRFRRLWRQ
jgi:hypothetical protein